MTRAGDGKLEIDFAWPKEVGGHEMQYAVILSVPHGQNTTFFSPTVVTEVSFYKYEVPYLSTDSISSPKRIIPSHRNLMGPSYFSFKT